MKFVETPPGEDPSATTTTGQAMPEHLMVKWHQWQNNPLHMQPRQHEGS
jgi:hypothetical protein